MISPNDETELAEAIRAATGPFAIQGGGTRGVHVNGTPLSTAAVSGITTYEPGALTLVAKAGTPLEQIEKALAEEKQMFAFEPMDHRKLMGTKGTPTIGGVVAANLSGPRRVLAGACRDFLLGVRFVDGRGEVVQNGGRVMKNVTGYDLARLQCGAHGTLGVLTEVGFKILPRPEASATLIFVGLDEAATVDLLARSMGTSSEVSGAAQVPSGVVGDQSAVLLRLEGFEDSVKHRSKALTEKLKVSPDQIEMNHEKNADIWKQVRDVTTFADQPGDVWHLSIKPTDLAQITDLATQDDMLVDWAGGRVWVRTTPGTDVRTTMNVPGHATLVRSESGDTPRFQPEDPTLAGLAANLRQKFDPRGILNPGLMG